MPPPLRPLSPRKRSVVIDQPNECVQTLSSRLFPACQQQKRGIQWASVCSRMLLVWSSLSNISSKVALNANPGLPNRILENTFGFSSCLLPPDFFLVRPTLKVGHLRHQSMKCCPEQHLSLSLSLSASLSDPSVTLLNAEVDSRLFITHPCPTCGIPASTSPLIRANLAGFSPQMRGSQRYHEPRTPHHQQDGPLAKRQVWLLNGHHPLASLQ